MSREAAEALGRVDLRPVVRLIDRERSFDWFGRVTRPSERAGPGDPGPLTRSPSGDSP